MSTAFQQLADAIVAGFKAAPALAGGRVSAPRRVPVPEEWPSHVEVRLVGANRLAAAAPADAPSDWATTFGVDLYARPAVAGSDSTAELDALLQAAHERLAGLAFAGLGVIDVDSVTSIDWDHAQGATALSSAAIQVVIRHRTVGRALQPAA